MKLSRSTEKYGKVHVVTLAHCDSMVDSGDELKLLPTRKKYIFFSFFYSHILIKVLLKMSCNSRQQPASRTKEKTRRNPSTIENGVNGVETECPPLHLIQAPRKS